MSEPTPPPRYVPYGSWAEHVPVIERMVENGWGVTAAVRKVVADKGFENPEHAFRGIRAAYYEHRKRQRKSGKAAARPARRRPAPTPAPSKEEEFAI